MGKAKTSKNQKGPDKHIADQILYQIGQKVVISMIVIAVMVIIMSRSVIISSKETELTLESQSAAHQLADFFDPYIRMTQQLAVNPQVIELMEAATPNSKPITELEEYPTVFENMVNITGVDSIRN